MKFNIWGFALFFKVKVALNKAGGLIIKFYVVKFNEKMI